MKVALVCVIVSCLAIPLSAGETRPARNPLARSENLPKFERLLGFFETHSPKPPDDLPPLVAGIAPHASYNDAGRAYYPLFQKISAPEVVIFGVTHRATRAKLGQPQGKLILDSHATWLGPYGKIGVSPLRERLGERLDPRFVLTSDEAHRMDHSIENVLPFLQHARRDVRITPIMTTAMPFDAMDAVSSQVAEVIDVYMKEKNLELGRDVFILISADANHYGKDFNNTFFGAGQAAHTKGTEHDRWLVRTYLEGVVSAKKLEGLTRRLWGKDFTTYGEVVWCGHYSIPFGLLTTNHLAEKRCPGRRLAGRLFYYTDSLGERVRPPLEPGEDVIPSSLDHWVGFFSAGFYLQSPD